MVERLFAYQLRKPDGTFEFLQEYDDLSCLLCRFNIPVSNDREVIERHGQNIFGDDDYEIVDIMPQVNAGIISLDSVKYVDGLNIIKEEVQSDNHNLISILSESA